ncbi:MarR family transcriptional regulator [Anoxybacterium hadale]|uniref:MarR family transcriptional regulator n=1 Tax=Anoxybacterium hadale TaxID=3408580 RepID=A0ACD1AH80_9FIRM|nr:MarR family transcriptional regulator [Clostridiales bacterium]
MQNSELLSMIVDFTNVFNEFNNKAFKFIDAQLNKTGLVRTHFIILHELVGGKELSMSDLSEILHVTKPNITVLIDKLVKLDYVERVNNSQDRRVILIRLTGKGEAFIGKSSEELIKSVVQLLDYLDQEDLDVVKQTTQAMKTLIAKLNKK